MQLNCKSFFIKNITSGIVVSLFYLAFIIRDAYGLERFCFFYSIYAFWIGLFGACELLNSYLENGEWRYWVLGFRRAYVKSFLGIFFANIIISSILYLIYYTIFLFLFLLIGNDIIANSNDIASSIFLSRFRLDLLLPVFMGGLLAVISGCCIGTFISSIFPKSIALKVTIGYMLLVLICSDSILDLANSNWVNNNPVYLQISKDTKDHINDITNNLVKKQHVKDWERKKYKKEIGFRILSKISYILPQRYFYNVTNIAHIGKDSIGDSNIKEIIKNITNKNPPKIKNKYGTFEKDVVSLFKPIVIKSIMLEVLLCFILDLVFFIFTILIITKMEKYYELR